MYISYEYFSNLRIHLTDELEAELLLKKEEMESLGEETTKLRTEMRRYKTLCISS